MKHFLKGFFIALSLGVLGGGALAVTSGGFPSIIAAIKLTLTQSLGVGTTAPATIGDASFAANIGVGSAAPVSGAGNIQATAPSGGLSQIYAQAFGATSTIALCASATANLCEASVPANDTVLAASNTLHFSTGATDWMTGGPTGLTSSITGSTFFSGTTTQTDGRVHLTANGHNGDFGVDVNGAYVQGEGGEGIRFYTSSTLRASWASTGVLDFTVSPTIASVPIPKTLYGSFSGVASCTANAGFQSFGISSCSRIGAGHYNVTLSSFYNTTKPSCTGSIHVAAASFTIDVIATSLTVVDVYTMNSTTGAVTDQDFSIKCDGT